MLPNKIILSISLLLLVAAVIFSLTLITSLFLYEPDLLGMQPSEITASPIFLASCAGVFFGIALKPVFDAIQKKRPASSALRILPRLKEGIIRAAVISPVVLAVVMPLLEDTASATFAFIFGYQNGFFFESILAKGPPDEKK